MVAAFGLQHYVTTLSNLPPTNLPTVQYYANPVSAMCSGSVLGVSYRQLCPGASTVSGCVYENVEVASTGVTTWSAAGQGSFGAPGTAVFGVGGLSRSGACGCLAAHSQEVHALVVVNRGGRECEVEVGVLANTNVCSGRGTLSGQVCLCQPGWAGHACQTPVPSSPVGVLSAPLLVLSGTNSFAEFTYDPQAVASSTSNGVAQYAVAVFTSAPSNGTNCGAGNLIARVRYECRPGACVPSNTPRYPVTSSPDQALLAWGSPTSSQRSAVFVQASVLSNCGCSNAGLQNATWIVSVSNSHPTDACEVRVITQGRCGAGFFDPTLQSCVCPASLAGTNCEITVVPVPLAAGSAPVRLDLSRVRYPVFSVTQDATSPSFGSLSIVASPVGGVPCSLAVYAQRACQANSRAGQCRAGSTAVVPVRNQASSVLAANSTFPAVYVPTSLDAQCGCTAGAAGYRFEHVFSSVVDERAVSSTGSCPVSVAVVPSSPCSNRGTFSASSRTCTCDSGSGGLDCSVSVITEVLVAQSAAAETRTAVTVPAGGAATSLVFQSPPNATLNLFSIKRTLLLGASARLTALQATSCPGMSLKIVASCGCDPVAATAGQVTNSGTLLPTANLSVVATQATWQGGCGCSGANGALIQPAWFTILRNLGPAPCPVTVVGSLDPLCPGDGLGRRCFGRGACSYASQCECEKGRVGYNCGSNFTTVEPFNGLTVTASTSTAAEPIRFELPLSKTSQLVNLTVEARSGFFGSSPVTAASVGVYVRVGSPVDLDLVATYPSGSSTVTYKPGAKAKYDYIGAFTGPTGVFMFNRTSNEATKATVYFAVFPPAGITAPFAVATITPAVYSESHTPPSTTFFSIKMTLTVEDKTGTAVDIALAILLAVVVLGYMIYLYISKKKGGVAEEDAWKKAQKATKAAAERKRKLYEAYEAEQARYEAYVAAVAAYEAKMRERGLKRSAPARSAPASRYAKKPARHDDASSFADDGGKGKGKGKGKGNDQTTEEEDTATDFSALTDATSMTMTAESQSDLGSSSDSSDSNTNTNSSYNSYDSSYSGEAAPQALGPFGRLPPKKPKGYKRKTEKEKEEEAAKRKQEKREKIKEGVMEAAAFVAATQLVNEGQARGLLADTGMSQYNKPLVTGDDIRDAEDGLEAEALEVDLDAEDVRIDVDQNVVEDLGPPPEHVPPPKKPAGYDAEMAKRAKAAQPGASKNLDLFTYVAAGVMALVSTIGDIFRLIFNVGLIHSSFYHALPLVTTRLDILRPQVDVLDDLARILGPAAKVMRWVATVVDKLTFVGWLQRSWTCGGSIVLLAPFAVILLTVVLRRVLGRDLLLILSISVGSFKAGKNSVVKLLIGAVSSLLTVFCLYVTQLLLVGLHSLVVATFVQKRSCSKVDRIAIQYSKVIVSVCVAILVLTNFYLFAGSPKLGNNSNSKFGALMVRVFGLIGGSVRIVLLTLGLWPQRAIEAHSINFRASKFDDDDEDDDTKHLEVLSITGSSRGLIWMVVPMTLVLAKLAEAVNTPPIFVLSKQLTLSRSFKVRFILWFCHVLQLGLVIGVLFVPRFSKQLVYAIPVTFVMPFFLAIAHNIQSLKK